MDHLRYFFLDTLLQICFIKINKNHKTAKTAMNNKYLTTGQAASRCSVSADTVLKWIRSGLLPAQRTAGGHHRISETDLDRVLQPSRPISVQANDYTGKRHFRYCWDYNGDGELLDTCRGCPVYQMRARRCYEVARLALEAGPPKKFCKVSCEDCEYYHIVHEQGINVLVITDSVELTHALKDSGKKTSYNLEFADCEYACSAVVSRFRPDFAIVDCSLGSRTSQEITYHLSQDPRVPFVKVVLAGSNNEYPQECDKEVFARIVRPFGIREIKECIEGINNNTD
jgi:excisionase family DNA binding protein